jgi:3-deoxy-7-phosphoheptulonate synthase
MIIKVSNKALESDVQRLKNYLKSQGFELHESLGKSHRIIGVVGDTVTFDATRLYAYDCVESVVRVQEPYKKVNRKFHPDNTVIKIGDINIGGDEVIVIAGPCSVESFEQTDIIAKAVKNAGATILRGGAFKPRTSPYSFQGLGVEGLRILHEVGKKYQMPVVSELTSIEHIDLFLKYVDIIQIGARNMQNFHLLKAIGKTNKPILLKRGFSNTIEEWLMSAEYILSEGNPNVILCERGIRTFEPYTRNTLDISTIPIIKKVSHLPIIIDPSHAAGKWDYVESMSLASIAAGADGLMIEVHHDPENAWSDGAQSLKPNKFEEAMKKIEIISNTVGRKLAKQ